MIEPTFNIDDILDPPDFVMTPPGMYKMKLDNLKLSTNRKGNKQLSAWWVHTEAKTYNGVRASYALEGTDKNGNGMDRQTAEFLVRMGVPKEALKAHQVSSPNKSFCNVQELSPLDEADFKGVDCQILVNGEDVLPKLLGKEVQIKVEHNTFNGKTTARAANLYPLKTAGTASPQP
jgi:hypothetical protein